MTNRDWSPSKIAQARGWQTALLVLLVESAIGPLGKLSEVVTAANGFGDIGPALPGIAWLFAKSALIALIAGLIAFGARLISATQQESRATREESDKVRGEMEELRGSIAPWEPIGFAQRAAEADAQ